MRLTDKLKHYIFQWFFHTAVVRLQCEYFIEIYSVLSFPLVALLRRSTHRCLCEMTFKRQFLRKVLPDKPTSIHFDGGSIIKTYVLLKQTQSKSAMTFLPKYSVTVYLCSHHCSTTANCHCLNYFSLKVAEYVVNLDLPPIQRWVEVGKAKKNEVSKF